MKRWAPKQAGFTIVELLIVIVVIGILAAIVIVAYNGIQNSAYNTTVEADLASATKALELIRVDQGRYPTSMAASSWPLSNFKFSKSAYLTTLNNALYCLDQTTEEYALGVISKSGTGYMLTKTGVQKGATVTVTSVCGAVGTTWGGSPPVPTTAVHGYNPSGSMPFVYQRVE